MRGSIVPRILPQIILVALVASVVVVAHDLNPLGLPSFGATPFGLVGIALSVFLAFRNNVSYDRWWEGRKLWGQLITVSRTLCRQSMLLIDGADQTHRTALLRMVSAFAVVKDYSEEERHNLFHLNDGRKIKVGKIGLTYEGVVSRLKTGLGSKDPESLQPHVLREYEKIFTRATCPSCAGTRLGAGARNSLIDGKSIADLSSMQVSDLAPFIRAIQALRWDRFWRPWRCGSRTW